MKLKTSRIQALERGLPTTNTSDIELLGTEALIVDKDYAQLIEQKEINSSTNSCISLFGINTKFFYSITLVCEDHGFTERGLGYVFENEGKFFLKRFRPFYMIDNGVPVPLLKPRPVVCSLNDYVTVSSYVPTTFVEVLTEANSIITSESPHLPTSVVVNKNSVLGRHDGNLESLPLDSLVGEDSARKSVTDYNKNLSLKSPKVDVKRLTANNIQLNATKTAPERKGVIYYDESDDCLKYYDGTTWRSLIWKQD